MLLHFCVTPRMGWVAPNRNTSVKSLSLVAAANVRQRNPAILALSQLGAHAR